MNYLGDFPTGATVYVPFHTFNAAGASVTLTGLATTDIEIYKNGVATTRASESGYTLLATDGIDFDSKTGIHGFSIDLSDNTDAGFYAAGNEYMVVVASVTVDAQTVNFVAATFSVERAGGALALLKHATYGLSAIETLVDDLESRLTAARAGYLDNINNAALATTVAQTGDTFARLGAPAGASMSADIADLPTVAEFEARTLVASGYATATALDAVDNLLDTEIASIKAVTDKVDTALELDGAVYRYTVNALELAPTGGSAPTAAAIRAEIDANSTQLAAIVADTSELQTDWHDGGRLDLILDAAGSAGDPWSTPLPGAYGAGTAGKIIGDNITGDAYARLGAPAGASVSADVAAVKTQTAAIETDTQDLQTQIGAAGAGLTAADDAVISAIAALNNLSSAQAQSAATAALNAYDPPTNAEFEARTLIAASYFDPAADVVAHVTLVDTTTTNTDMVAAAPTAAANADAVWDELLAGHVGAGSAGLALAAASSGGVDPSVLADAIWDEALSGHSTAGTTGKKLTDLANADLSGVATSLALADVPTVAEFEARTLAAADYTVVSDLPSVPSTADIKAAVEADGGKLDHLWEMTEDDGGVRRLTTNSLEQAPTGGAAPSAAAVADAVWDEALAGHVIVGSAGAGLAAAGSAGDPWSTTLPGAYTGNQAGAILDSIRDVTDAIDVSAVTVTASNDAGVLTVVQAVTFGATVSGLTISATWAKLYWTLKESIYDDDDQAIVQLVESNPGVGTDGLLYLDSAAIVLPITVADGTLTVNQTAGTVAIVVSDNATALLSAASELVWDIKTKDAAGATVQNTTGTASIVRAVTQTI